MRLSRLKVDPDKAANGVWTEFAPGIRVLVARANNPAYQAKVRELSKPYQAKIRAGTMDDDKMQQLIRRAFAECVLLDWEGIDEEQVFSTGEEANAAVEGNPDWTGRAPVYREEESHWAVPIPYSPEKAYEFFSDPALADFYQFVLITANEVALYRTEVDRDTGKT